MTAAFDAARCEQLVRERGLTLGVPLSYQAVTESTNDDALAAARAGAPHGSCFVADSQTRGRGRRGHEWRATAGKDLTFSLVLRPALEPRSTSPLTLVVGLALRAVLARLVDCEVQLKWPNDVYAAGRKLCGILLESQLAGSRLSCVVAGIGVNVNSTEFSPELSASATSLALLGSSNPSREELLASICAELEPRISSFEASGLAGFSAELNRFDYLKDKRLRVEGVEGVGAGIDSDGALLVATDAGSRRLLAGSVEPVAS